jgi:hypothetical protein
MDKLQGESVKMIPDSCTEAYFSIETARKIDKIMREFRAGKLLTKPLEAGDKIQSSPGRSCRFEQALRTKNASFFWCSKSPPPEKFFIPATKEPCRWRSDLRWPEEPENTVVK